MMTVGERLKKPPKPLFDHRISFEEFLQLDERRIEFVDGWVVPLPPVNKRHQEALVFFLAVLRNYRDFKQLGGRVLGEFHMRADPDLPTRRPDVLYLRPENESRMEDLFLNGPADAVIEIISPGSYRRDGVEKFEEYRQGGVSEYWLIDPRRQQARFYRLESSGPSDAKGIYRPVECLGGRFQSSVLDGFWLQLDWLWNDPPASTKTVLQAWGLLGDS